jgi:hypothetical protein
MAKCRTKVAKHRALLSYMLPPGFLPIDPEGPPGLE